MSGLTIFKGVGMRKFLVGILILSVVFVCLAADNTGVVGNIILGWFEKMFKVSPEVALSIYTTILLVLGIVLRVVLTKIPGGVDGPIGKAFWWVMGILFGDNVKLQNNTDSATVKAALKKKYPLLNIEIK